MTRLSTGYTFLNIQEHCKYILKNIDKIDKVEKYNLGYKYKFLDNIFLKVLKKNPEKMPNIFYKMFKCSPNTVIKFLSNKRRNNGFVYTFLFKKDKKSNECIKIFLS